MAGMLALIGGEEFSPGFEDVHARMVSLVQFVRPGAQGRKVRVVFLPTCAAEDGAETVDYWCDLARQKLEPSGAVVSCLKVVDRASANNAEWAQQVLDADWIYFGGGYPHVAMNILRGSFILQAIYAAHQQGASIAGASAGAMLMCTRSWVITPELDAAVSHLIDKNGTALDWDLPLPSMLECLGLVSHSVCWPHINRLYSAKWLEQGFLPAGYTLMGIDEQTAAISLAGDHWDVLGRGRVILVDSQLNERVFHAGERFILPA